MLGAVRKVLFATVFTVLAAMSVFVIGISEAEESATSGVAISSSAATSQNTWIPSMDLMALPERMVTLRAMKSGTISEIENYDDRGNFLFEYVEGVAVNAGDVLGIIEAEEEDARAVKAEETIRQYDAEMATTYLKFKEAERKMEQYRYLRDNDLVSPAEFAQVQLSYLTSRIQWEEVVPSQYRRRQAEYRMNDRLAQQARVTAPFDGVITKRFVREHEWLSSGTEIFEIVDPSRVIFTVDVPATYRRFFKTEAKADFAESSIGGKSGTTPLLTEEQLRSRTEAREIVLRRFPALSDSAEVVEPADFRGLPSDDGYELRRLHLRNQNPNASGNQALVVRGARVYVTADDVSRRIGGNLNAEATTWFENHAEKVGNIPVVFGEIVGVSPLNNPEIRPGNATFRVRVRFQNFTISATPTIERVFMPGSAQRIRFHFEAGVN
ncbi:MAG: HlyD family efflux transporter periplasmic adaptor subunit [Planctomycetes bacterium]|nr:HlyD family efflux transporter periplasmic adaptor subunit [Planctomycetota bacterium]